MKGLLKGLRYISNIFGESFSFYSMSSVIIPEKKNGFLLKAYYFLACLIYLMHAKV